MTKPVLPPDLTDSLDPATILVRGGATRSPYDETCEALFMTSGFVYDNAAAAEAAFAQDGSRYRSAGSTFTERGNPAPPAGFPLSTATPAEERQDTRGCLINTFNSLEG